MDTSAGSPDVAALRRDYADRGLDEADVAAGWPDAFARWLADAVAAGLPEPNAMVVATADAAGAPSARTVLLKAWDERGFVFFTNLESRKGRELQANPAVALVFPWHPLERQVLVQGRAALVDRDEVEAYFASRPRGSRLGAWASPQSRVVDGRAELDRRWAEVAARFGDDGEVPPPPHWGGVRVEPLAVELWQGRPSRMHDRLRWTRDGSGWRRERLAP